MKGGDRGPTTGQAVHPWDPWVLLDEGHDFIDYVFLSPLGFLLGLRLAVCQVSRTYCEMVAAHAWVCLSCS